MTTRLKKVKLKGNESFNFREGSSPQHSARIKGWSKARLARISAKKS